MTHHVSGPPGGFRSSHPAAPPLSTATLPHTGGPSPDSLYYSPPNRTLGPDTPETEPPPHKPCAGRMQNRLGGACPHLPNLIGLLGCQSLLAFSSLPARSKALPGGDFRLGRSCVPRAGPCGGRSRLGRAAALQGEPWTARAGRWWCATTALG